MSLRLRPAACVLLFLDFFLKDIHTAANEDNVRSVAELAYFEGDFWPNVIEESIRELQAEEEEERKAKSDDGDGDVSLCFLAKLSF